MAPRWDGYGYNDQGIVPISSISTKLDPISSISANVDAISSISAALDVAILMGVATFLYIILLIFSHFVARRHAKSHVWRLVTSSLSFSILYSVMVMVVRVLKLTTYLVQSDVIFLGCKVMFGLIADLLLLAACWGFLHNRLRAVGVPRKSVSVIAGLHWFLLATMSCLALIQAVGWWLQSALYLSAFTQSFLLTGATTTYAEYMGSVFYQVHLKNVQGAWIVLLWIWVLEMMVVAIILALKEAKWKPAAHTDVPVKKTYASLIFLLCVLLPLFTTTLGILIMTFQYSTAEDLMLAPFSTEVTYYSLKAFPTVVAFAGLCAVGMNLTQDQWARGGREWDGEQNQNSPPQQHMPHHPPQQHPPQQHMSYDPPPQQNGYPPQEQYISGYHEKR